MRKQQKKKFLIIILFTILFDLPTIALADEKLDIGDTCTKSEQCESNFCGAPNNKCYDPFFTEYQVNADFFCCLGKSFITCVKNNPKQQCLIEAQCLSGYCHTFNQQSFENTCAKYNLKGCANATDCNKQGHIWTQANNSCITENLCQSEDGIVVNSALYGKICTSENLPQCAPNPITDCVYYEVSNDSTCTTKGGVWSQLLGDMYCVKLEKAETAVCGNGKPETGEDCDDGNNTNADGCSATCKTEKVETAVCGNSKTETGEDCDDGNNKDKDGCSATCKTENNNGAGNTEKPCAPTCKAWEKCDAAQCVLSPGKCATDTDCKDPNKICDVKHDCIDKKTCTKNNDCDILTQFCDAYKFLCLPLLAAGETCKSKEYCASALCTNGLCGCANATHCTANQFCDTAKNSCQNKVAIGDPCPADPKNCLSGACATKESKNVCICSLNSQCSASQYCGTGTGPNAGSCLEKLGKDAPCAQGSDAACLSGTCLVPPSEKIGKCTEPPPPPTDPNAAATPGTATPVATPTKYQTVPPKMSVSIPGLAPFESTEVTTGEMVSIPWIAQYIVAVYKYAIVIGAIIAVLALMVGGVQYLIGGAYTEAVSGAKKIMLGAMGGLVLLLASNLILQMINPQLTKLGALSLSTVVPIDYNVIADKDSEGGYISGGSSGTCKAPKNSVLEYCGITTNSAAHPNKEALIQKLKNWAACGNFNYNILMGMAEHESSFRPGLVNCCCFKGLFQFKNDTWTFSMTGWPGGKDAAYYLSQIGLSTSPLSKTDPRLFNDDVQIMGITGATMMAKKIIYSKCKGDISKLSDSDIATLLYLFHNSGIGSLGNALVNGGCKGGNNIETGFIKSWTDIITNRCKENAFDKKKATCTAGDGGYQNDKWTGGVYKSIAEATAGGKMFGEGKAISVRKAGASRIIGKYKAANLFQAVPGAGTCPIKTK